MITTPDLIATLATNLEPVRRLRPPLVRAGGWVLLAVAIIAMLGVAHGLRNDIGLRLHEPVFATTLAAGLATGVLAAIAIFYASQPDRSLRWLLFPVPPLVLWVSTVSYGCLTNWVSIGAAGIQLGETARCFATLLLTSVPLALAMYMMVRRAAPLRPTLVCAAGGIAIGGFTAAALSLLHELDASAMVLIWTLATTAIFAALGAIMGRRLPAVRAGYEAHA